ncbi:MAG: hypothetical protein IJ060_06700 [Oscillospiraceae bacterium]|nr:hypothetical protein [Oscillospiraceae bacterium]
MEQYNTENLPSVHRGIVRAAAILLELEQHPAAKRYSAGDIETMVGETTAPDRAGDRQKGKGLHYYCAVTPDGRPLPYHPMLGGYCNANRKPAPSPLTMLDAEYRAALMLYRAGKYQAAMTSLSRALHMLADVCCPPHSCSMTYFSRYAYVHKRYESQAKIVFWSGQDQEAAPAAWAEKAIGTVPYDAYRDILRGTRPQADGTWLCGQLTVVLNRLALSGAEEIGPAVEDDADARAESISRRVLLSIANSAALLAAFDRDVDDPHIRLYEERRPYWLKGVGKPYAVSEEPLYLQFDEDGAVTLSTQEGRFLAVTKLGLVRLTDQTSGLVTRFRFGREPLLALYPNGDQNRPLMIAGGKLLCAYRKLQKQDEIFARRVSFVLVHEKPEHVSFLLK